MNGMPLVRLPINSHRCCYNDCQETNALKVVPKKERIEILQRYKLFVSKRATICGIHIKYHNWNECRRFGIENFSGTHLKEIMEILATNQVKKRNELKRQDSFNVSHYDIGIEASDFTDLLSHLHHLRRTLKNEQKCKIALAMYLMRLRTGDFLYRLQKTFNLSYETQKKYLNVVRESICTDFVPLHLGLENLTRQVLLQNSSKMAHVLYDPDDHIILVADATYVFYVKSGNYEVQRATYNDQKKRNFVKPMVITTSNGFFVDIFGPYKATTNDASILKHVFQNFGPFSQLQPGDIFLLDRGFRDCKEFLETNGFDARMPDFIQKKDKTTQLTTSKGNASRMVTACRFVIESRNGHMKNIWKIFNKTLTSYEMRHLMDDFKIGAALINAYFCMIESNEGKAENFAQLMKRQMVLENDFSIIINRYSFQSNCVKHFIEKDADNIAFSRLQLDDLKEITLGSYQVKQSSSYIIDHLKRNSKFLLYECPRDIVENCFGKFAKRQENVKHLQVYLTYFFSRFSKNSKHAVYILVDTSLNGKDGIVGHTCDCKHGLRVVGCCSHISALIAYLGYYRHVKDKIKPVSEFMDAFFLN